eukprot:gb/GECG01013411.1/.p1 GENE.gb/GECG01013411.1/~~gb/GECG01013411.1/.p1  ORF type:complete len:335 (+),score=38.59 gb/GECG01013411.1/:1-1005(+)
MIDYTAGKSLLSKVYGRGERKMAEAEVHDELTKGAAEAGALSRTEASEHPVHVCVGVDSTKERSLYAFTRALRLLKSNDRLTVLHISNPFKDLDERLPADVNPDNIENFYTTRLTASISSSRWNYELVKKKSKDQTTHSALCEYVNYSKNAVDVLVVGFTGRKGRKADSSVAGSTVDQALRKAFLPVLVCKRIEEEPDSPASAFNWVVSIDGTKYSESSLKFTQKVAKEDDHIIILHVEDETAQNMISSQYRAFNIKKRYRDCNKQDKRLSYQQVTSEHGHPVSDEMCRYIRDRDVDILVAGAGHKESFSSTAERLVRLAETDILIYQNKGHYF